MFRVAVDALKLCKSKARRETAVVSIQQQFSKVCRINFESFQIQAIMRTIEICIHEPFGPVLNIPQTSRGHGSKVAAQCLCQAFHSTPDELPGKIVQVMNDNAKKAFDGGDKVIRNIMNDRVTVLGLVWNSVGQCLVHSSGIGKKLDASDTEHMLCMFYTLHQNTLPSRNQNSGYPRLDRGKYYPIRYTKGTCLASELPVLKHIMDDKHALEAFERLAGLILIDNDLFSVDIT